MNTTFRRRRLMVGLGLTLVALAVAAITVFSVREQVHAATDPVMDLAIGGCTTKDDPGAKTHAKPTCLIAFGDSFTLDASLEALNLSDNEPDTVAGYREFKIRMDYTDGLALGSRSVVWPDCDTGNITDTSGSGSVIVVCPIKSGVPFDESTFLGTLLEVNFTCKGSSSPAPESISLIAGVVEPFSHLHNDIDGFENVNENATVTLNVSCEASTPTPTPTPTVTLTSTPKTAPTPKTTATPNVGADGSLRVDADSDASTTEKFAYHLVGGDNFTVCIFGDAPSVAIAGYQVHVEWASAVLSFEDVSPSDTINYDFFHTSQRDGGVCRPPFGASVDSFSQSAAGPVELNVQGPQATSLCPDGAEFVELTFSCNSLGPNQTFATANITMTGPGVDTYFLDSSKSKIDVDLTSVQIRCMDGSVDSDLDGCTNAQELGSSEVLGGRRDPLNFWDFFDTPNTENVRDKVVTMTDIMAVAGRFGSGDPNIDPLSPPPPSPAYHTAFDRTPALPGADPWDLQAADGSIVLLDILAVANQFGHTCA